MQMVIFKIDRVMLFSVGLCLVVTALVIGCATPERKTARHAQRQSEAKTLFDRIAKDYHLPSAEARGDERDRLLKQAASGYEQLLRDYRDQPDWRVQAMRSLGNIRAEQGGLDEAIRLYSQVGQRYPQYEWDVIQAWKSAGDLLWEAGRHDEARGFYWRIVTRFDLPDAPSVYKMIIRGCHNKLNE